MLLWAFIAATMILYFGVLSPVAGKYEVVALPVIIILAFSVLGMGGKLRRGLVRDSREHLREFRARRSRVSAASPIRFMRSRCARA